MKVMYNGFKRKGEKLEKFSLNYGQNEKNHYDIYVYAQKYRFSEAVKKEFSVINNSNYESDYVVEDFIVIKKDHPRWNEFLKGCIQEEEKAIVRLQRKVLRLQEKIEKFDRREDKYVKECRERDIKAIEEKIEKMKGDFND